MKITHWLLALAMLSGCSHYHTLTVTSEPTGQVVEVRGRGGLFGDSRINPEGDVLEEVRTPCEFTFSGEVEMVTIQVADQTKQVSFQHGRINSRAICEPILGLPLLIEKTLDQPLNKSVHFDIAPVGSR